MNFAADSLAPIVAIAIIFALAAAWVKLAPAIVTFVE